MRYWRALDIANYFLIKYGLKPKPRISQLKLQKLVYFAHGWHMAFYDDPLVTDEFVEAWRYGPVFPSIYHQFKFYGRNPISSPATTERGVQFITVEPPDHPKIIDLLDKIWEVYGWRTAGQLSTMCHQKGTPWDITRQFSRGMKNAFIEDELIREHFKKKIRP